MLPRRHVGGETVATQLGHAVSKGFDASIGPRRLNDPARGRHAEVDADDTEVPFMNQIDVSPLVGGSVRSHSLCRSGTSCFPEMSRAVEARRRPLSFCAELLDGPLAGNVGDERAVLVQHRDAVHFPDRYVARRVPP